MSDCPCESGQDYDDCCGPLLAGERQAETAEALMRSRYTAFTRADVGYIERTVHPETREEFDEEGARAWAEGSQWLGLEIHSTKGGAAGDERGEVEFTARYRQDGESVDHLEVADFRRHEGRWYFYDGRLVGQEPYVREAPKVGRNEPCPCGSGKKFKKCCGR